MPPLLSGVLPVIQTPFTDDGSIDFDDLRHELHWVLDQGVQGVTTGMVSEVLRMSTDERRALTETVCEVVRARPDGKVSVISCGAESTRTATELARHAEVAGADALMAIPPVSINVDDAALHEYFSAILDSCTLPLVVQDASGYVGRPLSIALQADLLATYGDRVYFKPEAAPIGPRLSALRDATLGQARIFEGTGGSALVDSYRRGIVGTMPGAEVCWAIQALWNALESEDWDLVYRLSGPLTGLVALQSGIDGFVAVEKHFLVNQGVLRSSRVRGPSGFSLDKETAAEADRLFAQLAVATGRAPAPVAAEGGRR
ncbi:dihydrodipicolinate synthase family protein [Nocardioides carbamazepini]|uniref:dihydrodipicolinate synthase family protein n=1 Tax=Nocardioides carbamazepini TaxID=2854259 RepID=UPI00214A29E9|nr:dihydrodipicolinate synthase family protein [Nocardioides carbamazepini]MCR1781879.1 dihydrodipicolinate synthase family protein [Nocardioides carbamazepini]